MHLKRTLLIGLAPLALAACGEPASEADQPAVAEETMAPAEADAPEGITLTDASIKLPAVAGRPGVAYFSLASALPEPVEIVSVAVTGVGRTEMHETKMQDGVSSMAAVERVVLAPDGTVSFAPGGYHVMLFDLDPALAAGQMADLTISFANGDKASIPTIVVAAGGEPAHAEGHDMGAMH